MTCYGGRELAASFRTVRGNTIQIAEDIPEENYGFKAAPGTRTIGQLLAHIAFIPRVALEIHRNRIDDLRKLDFPALVQRLAAEEAKPRTKSELIALLRTEGDAFGAFLEQASDEFLAERVAMPPHAQPQTKSRLEMLLSPKEHEMHHRGQLMLCQRMLGVVPHLTRQMQQRFAHAAQQGAGAPTAR
jgi:uncharacterized damage-inducible protein DinB